MKRLFESERVSMPASDFRGTNLFGPYPFFVCMCVCFVHVCVHVCAFVCE